MGEPRLDHVDAETAELYGDLHLLLDAHGGPGRLLAVPQRRIENHHAIHEDTPFITEPMRPVRRSFFLLFSIETTPLRASSAMP